MPYLVSQLIADAYYVSGIVSRGFQTPTPDQESDGLTAVNTVLSFKASDFRLVPYFQNVTFNANPMGVPQEEYFIPNLVDVETLTFNIGPIRYSMRRQERKQYFGTGRTDNIASLPWSYHIERCLGGANIFLYYLPESAYVMSLWGKFGLTDVTATTDLLTYYDMFYTDYLKYAVAEYLCNNNSITFLPQNQLKLREYEKSLTDLSPFDLTTQKISTLRRDVQLNYGDINLGKGWRPSG